VDGYACVEVLRVVQLAEGTAVPTVDVTKDPEGAGWVKAICHLPWEKYRSPDPVVVL
jgi:hypothetical protein